MNMLTVGDIEERLRRFPKDTQVHLTCGCCHHGVIGGVDSLGFKDETEQTYGYLELELNYDVTPQVECSKDKKEFYEKEIDRLNAIIKKQNYIIECYKSCTNSVSTTLSRHLNKIRGVYKR